MQNDEILQQHTTKNSADYVFFGTTRVLIVKSKFTIIVSTDVHRFLVIHTEVLPHSCTVIALIINNHMF